jgi:hypothetical protein
MKGFQSLGCRIHAQLPRKDRICSKAVGEDKHFRQVKHYTVIPVVCNGIEDKLSV